MIIKSDFESNIAEKDVCGIVCFNDLEEIEYIVKTKYLYVGNILGSLLKTEKCWILCGNGILCIEEISANVEGKLIRNPKELFTDYSVRLPC